jgi:neutral amino acid transport system ATP-binding protein
MGISLLLEAQGVSKAFGGIRALEMCSIGLEQGSITGLIGPNGSGKTTLFNVVTGYERVDSGQVLFAGKTITNTSPDKVFRLGIGRTFQLTRIFPRLTVLENMHVAARRNDLKGLLGHWSSSHEQDRVTFLVVEHNMEFVMSLCHKVMVMHRGRKIAEGNPTAVRTNPAVLEAYLGD